MSIPSRIRRSPTLMLSVAGLLTATFAGAAARPPIGALPFACPVTGVAKAVSPAPSQRLGLEVGWVPQVRLPAVDSDTLAREDEARERFVKAKRFGVGRPVEASEGRGEWFELEGGAALWVVDVGAEGALGLRLHFSAVNLPEGSEIAVYAPGKPGSPELFRAGTARSAFWTPSVFGDSARVEYYTPHSSTRDRLPFRIDALQHYYRDPRGKSFTTAVGSDAAGPCHNDVSCYPEWALTARAVGGLGSIVEGDSLFCTGQLLNVSARIPDCTPYFLTAHHCLSDQAEASDAEFFWFYQTPSCGAPPPEVSDVQRSVGATLIGTTAASDATLLLIAGKLPADVAFAGWTSGLVPDGTAVACIHHPSGDYKRISFGNTAGICDPGFLHINWTDGPTEPGSSGSGIFRVDTQQLFGQLRGGPSACGNETFDCYGAFRKSFGVFRRVLAAGPDDRFEPDDSCQHPRVLRPGVFDGLVVKSVNSDWYRVSIPRGKTLTATIEFGHTNGDLDLDVYDACDQDPLATSRTTGDRESVTVENPNSRPLSVLLHVYVTDNVRNNYKLTISTS